MLASSCYPSKKKKITVTINIETMRSISTKIYILFACLIVNTIAQNTNRKTIEFVIGGKDRGLSKGCNLKDLNIPITLPVPCPKPKTSIPLPPLPLVQELLQFADQRLAVVYPVIQNFKSIITSDPLGITKTWAGSDICNYKGFYCESPPDNKTAIAVASIDFNGFQLAAPSLDGFLDQLPDIALFHANSNNFAGPISPNIAKLPYLYELDISNNQFSGPFPTAVLGMDHLEFLDIRFNYFSGSVPPQIFTQNLDFLFINNNNFMMKLPDNIGNTHILFLTLANNKFIGPIPRNIFRAFSELTEVLLLNNQLTGCLPYEIGFLKEAIVFDAGNNQLTGPLPFSLACLERVEQLNFANNLLFGMVPEVLCELGNKAELISVPGRATGYHSCSQHYPVLSYRATVPASHTMFNVSII
ncbi:Leucine-rich repeat receptor-like protein kinase family [Melia azedarach]|uniref:Leucine-rich repeat receptor-like protein kinase family n=1 Tax=Melia azedarach TaxID=155640 RepID=A0ACC1WRV3_MELAZ|nr:Leucine-rich repeat receptor-like protein kinase family [Melia azedarach]